jgi:protein dithiol:quinone oxidoreductase
MSPTRRLALLSLACLAAVGLALVAQHGFDMQPCPWCILQRVIFIAVALVCGVAAWLPARGARFVAATLALALSLAGIAAALFQHEVAAKQGSCALTLADKIITAIGLERLWPAVFQVTATCADAAVSVLGVPFEYWSLALFAIVAGVLLTVLRATAGSR